MFNTRTPMSLRSDTDVVPDEKKQFGAPVAAPSAFREPWAPRGKPARPRGERAERRSTPKWDERLNELDQDSDAARDAAAKDSAQNSDSKKGGPLPLPRVGESQQAFNVRLLQTAGLSLDAWAKRVLADPDVRASVESVGREYRDLLASFEQAFDKQNSAEEGPLALAMKKGR